MPVKRVARFPREIRGINREARDHEAETLRKSQIPCFQEKPLSFSYTRPYRKPTLVREMSILRRLRELRRRNSAN